MAKMLSSETFMIFIKCITNDDYIENFMLTHKKTFGNLSITQKNDVIQKLVERNHDVTGTIDKMMRCGNVQLNKQLFVIIIEWFSKNIGSISDANVLRKTFVSDNGLEINFYRLKIPGYSDDEYSKIPFMDMLREFLNVHHHEHKMCDDNTRNQIIKYVCLNKNFSVNEYVKTCCYPTNTDKKLFKFFDLVLKMKTVCSSSHDDEEITHFFEYIIKHKFILESMLQNGTKFYGDLVELCSNLCLNFDKEKGNKYIKELFPDNVLCDLIKNLKNIHETEKIGCNPVVIKIIGCDDNTINPSPKKESNSSIINTDINLKNDKSSDEFKYDSTIICTLSNGEYVDTLHLNYNQSKCGAIVDYMKLHWGFDDNEIKFIWQPKMAKVNNHMYPIIYEFGRSFQLYADNDNHRFVFMNNENVPIIMHKPRFVFINNNIGPILNFVYST